MKYILSFLVLPLLGLSVNCKSANHVINNNVDSVEIQRPNIILILADDLGWMDVNYMGSTYYETPHIDKLASQGMQFSDAYAAAANCTPSRACLMSGQNTPRHGIYTVGTSERGNVATRKLIPTVNKNVLADDVYTLAEALNDAGYYTSIFGKWHIGADARTQGFDFKVGGNGKGLNKYFSPYENPGIEDGPVGEYLTDRLTTDAIKDIEDHKDEPFFIYLPHFAVHTPIEAPADLIQKYKNKANSSLQNDPVYAAMIESLDSNVGRLLQKLDDLDLAKNTIIIFSSDHGGIRAISNQAPLRAGKGSYYEGGLRVPQIIRWPGKVAPGSKSSVPVTSLDLYPTLLDILNVKSKSTLDGQSILPVLTGGTIPERPLYWHFPIYLQAYDKDLDDSRDPLFRTRPGSTIRLGNWKLHEYFEDGALELYNLKTDIGERNNVAAQNPAVTTKLHNMLKNWRNEVNAPVPTDLNPKYNPNFRMMSTPKKSRNKVNTD